MIRYLTIAILLLSSWIPAHAQDALPVVSATASTSDSNGASGAIDGDLKTRWSGLGDGAWLQLDLGSVQEVSKVAIAWYRGDQRTATFDLAISRDGQAWATVFVGQSSGKTLALEDIPLAPVEARYVRYIGHGNTSNGWNSVTEMVAYGASVAPPTPPPPPPPPQLVTLNVAWSAHPQADILSGFRLYYGAASGEYEGHTDLPVATAAQIEVPKLADTMYFTLTAFTDEAESENSNEIAEDMRQKEIVIEAPELGGVEAVPLIRRVIDVLQKIVQQLEGAK